jgi:putative PIN family toxin of toxin-antitoxin system
MKIVMDTNVLLMSIPKKSPYRKIFDGLIEGEYELVISNEILSEYLEILERKTNELVAKNIGEFLINSRSVQKIDIFYRWNLIEIDPDDNKFVDCPTT